MIVHVHVKDLWKILSISSDIPKVFQTCPHFSNENSSAVDAEPTNRMTLRLNDRQRLRPGQRTGRTYEKHNLGPGHHCLPRAHHHLC